MPLPRAIAAPLIPVAATVLHALPLKTRLGGVSTLLRRTLGLDAFTSPRLARLRNGMAIEVRLSDYNGRMLYLFGTPDPKVVRTCAALLRPGDVFLDIGANHGAVGLLAMSSVMPGGAVEMVEPQPALCAVIRRAIRDHGATGARVHEIGLWDEDGELTFDVPAGHTGAAHVSTEAPASEGATRVRVRAVDAFLDEVAGDRPFGAKIDVEGAEVKLLPAILRRPNLRFAVFECNRREMRDAVWEIVTGCGLAVFGLPKHLFRVRLAPLRGRADMDAFHDLVTVRMDPARLPARPVVPRKLARRVRE
jgi:FkbM family methyltransferase